MFWSFVWAGRNYIQGLHNVLRKLFHDKMNTALPKHSFAVKKLIKSLSSYGRNVISTD